MMSTEAEKPLRKFLKKVGHDHALVDLWWTGGADAVLRDPRVADEVEALTPDQIAALRDGDLGLIKAELDEEARTSGESYEDISAQGKNWALVRI
jgi:hypothetical protein